MNTMTLTQAKRQLRDRVKKSSKNLDKQVSEWYNAVDINRLHLNSFENCIIGQLRNKYGQYDKPLYTMNDMSVEDGFMLPDYFGIRGTKQRLYGWNYLNDLWMREILKRRRDS